MKADHAFVVLAYGESPFLLGCLESLAGQGSRAVVTTSTPCAHIDSAARRQGVPLIVNADQRGIGADWNFGLHATDARYVTLVHQDDLYRPGFADRSLAALSRWDAALCFTGYQQIDDHGRPVSSKVSRVQHLIEAVTLGGTRAPGPGRMRAFLSFGNPLPCSSVTFDRAKLSDFRFATDLASNLDWEAWIRLTQAGVRFSRDPERLIGRRRNPHTATSRLIASGQRQAEDLVMFRRLWPRPLSDLIALAYRAGY